MAGATGIHTIPNSIQVRGRVQVLDLNHCSLVTREEGRVIAMPTDILLNVLLAEMLEIDRAIPVSLVFTPNSIFKQTQLYISS